MVIFQLVMIKTAQEYFDTSSSLKSLSQFFFALSKGRMKETVIAIFFTEDSAKSLQCFVAFKPHIRAVRDTLLLAQGNVIALVRGSVVT